MGDGELTGGGIDISAGVTVEISLHRNLGWVRPVIETAAVWCTCGSAPDLSAAIQVATRDMVALLAQKLYLSREESFILVGAAGDIRIGQAAQVGVDQTVCLQISKTVLPSAI
jgi:amidase